MWCSSHASETSVINENTGYKGNRSRPIRILTYNVHVHNSIDIIEFICLTNVDFLLSSVCLSAGWSISQPLSKVKVNPSHKNIFNC